MFRHIFEGLEIRYSKELAVIRCWLVGLVFSRICSLRRLFSLLLFQSSSFPTFFAFIPITNWITLLSWLLTPTQLHVFSQLINPNWVHPPSSLPPFTYLSYPSTAPSFYPRAQYPSEPVQFTDQPLILHWGEGMQMLLDAGHEVSTYVGGTWIWDLKILDLSVDLSEQCRAEKSRSDKISHQTTKVLPLYLSLILCKSYNRFVLHVRTGGRNGRS